MERWRGQLSCWLLLLLIVSVLPIRAGVAHADQPEGKITFVSDEKIEGWATAPGSGDGRGNSIRFFDVHIQLKGANGTAETYRVGAVEVPADRNGEKKYTFSLDMRGKWPSAQGERAAYEITVDAYRVLGNGQEDLYFSFPEPPYEYTKRNEASTAALDFSMAFSQPEYAKPPNGNAEGRLDVTLIPKGSVSAPVRPPIDVAFVMDASGSMTTEKLLSAKAALRSAVDYFKAHSHPNDRFALIPFSDSVRDIVPFGDQPTVAAQLEKIRTVGDRLTAEGLTNYSAALANALNQLNFTDPKRKKYVIFLTDGMPTILSTRDAITYQEIIRKNNRHYNYTEKKITDSLDLIYGLLGDVAFISFKDKQGLSRVFTSREEDYANGTYVGRSGYPFSYKQIETKIQDHALNLVKGFGLNNITLYSIGFGDSKEVDMDYLRALSAVAGGEARQGTAQNLTALFQQFSQLATTPAITGTIRIPLSSFGGNVAIAENGQVWLDETKQNAYISFSIPYQIGQGAPPPVTIPVPVSFKAEGTYTFEAELTYRDVYGQPQPPVTKKVTVTVKDEAPPSFTGTVTLQGVTNDVASLIKFGAANGDDNRFRAAYSLSLVGYVGNASGTISNVSIIQELPDGISVVPDGKVTVYTDQGRRYAKWTFANQTFDYSQLNKLTLSEQWVMQADFAMNNVSLPPAVVTFTDSRYGAQTSTLAPPRERIGMTVRLHDFPNFYYEGNANGAIRKYQVSAASQDEVGSAEPNSYGLLPLAVKALQYDPNDDGVLLVTYRNDETVRIYLKPRLSITASNGEVESGATVTEAPTVRVTGLVAGERVTYEYEIARNGSSSDWQLLGPPYAISVSDDGEYTVAVRSSGGLTRGDGTTIVSFRYMKLIRNLTLGDYRREMNVGETQTIPVIIEPIDATNKTLMWESSDPDIASVGHNGVVTANKPGTAAIIVRATDGSGATARAVITVIDPYVPLEGMAFSSPVLYMKVGERLEVAPQLRFIPENATDKTIADVQSSAPAYVEAVNENGTWVLIANDVGYATVTATAKARTSDQKAIQAAVTVIVQEAADRSGDGRNRW